MAGGRGERLRPLTDTCPKPLLPVAGRPVLDRLLEKLSEAGIQDVTLAVGYLGPMIEDYVLDGARWGVRADYVRQVEPMGTAGALTLLKRRRAPILVVNGDKVFESANAIAYVAAQAHATDIVVGLTTYSYQVPHGVWKDAHLTEKPVMHYAISAGVYRIKHQVVKAAAAPMDMTMLVAKFPYCMTVPMQGYVLDIGTPATYEAATARLSSR